MSCTNKVSFYLVGCLMALSSFAESGEQIGCYATLSASVYNHKIINSVKAGIEIVGKPLLVGDSVYVGSYDHKLYKMTLDGKLVGKPIDLGEPVSTSPILLADGTICFGGSWGSLFFLKPGQPIKKMHIEDESFQAEPVQLKDGTVVVGGAFGKLYYVNPNDPKKPLAEVPLSASDPDSDSRPIDAPPYIMPDGSIAVGASDGYLYFVDQNKQVIDKLNLGYLVKAPAKIVKNGNEETLVVGSLTKTLYFIDPKTHKIINRFHTKSTIKRGVVETKNGELMVPSGDTLYFLSKKGDFLRSFSSPLFIDSIPAILSDGTIVYGGGDGNIYFLHPSGALKAKVPSEDKFSASPLVLKDDTVVIGDISGKISFVKLTEKSAINALTPIGVDCDKGLQVQIATDPNKPH